MRFFMAFLALLLPASIEAKVTVTFYSHELGTSFPHAFIVLKGSLDRGGETVDTNYGFTAKSVTPALLMGAVKGVIETAKPGYVKGSDPRFSRVIADGEYDSLMLLVEKWRTLPGKSYDLGSRNCLHFVGAAAEELGLKVEYNKKLMKKPRSFLENVKKLNPGLE